MGRKIFYTIFRLLIATVWLVNGLLCKVLNFVPRHREIVHRILQTEHYASITTLIGISEICMGIWIITGIKSRLNAILQITIIAAMNTLEFILAPDLLLWKQFNAVFAFMFICFIYINEFILNKKTSEV